MRLALDPWSIAALAVVLGIALWGLRMIKSRLDDQRYREELAEMEFERSLINSGLALDSSSDERFIPPTESQFKNEIADNAGSATPLFDPSPSHYPTATSKHENGATDNFTLVMEKLNAAGLIRTVDGYLELHGNPKGIAVLRLKSGKTALLVPHFESEAFLRRNEKRADMIILAGADGAAYVVRPISEFIAENLGGL